MEQWQTGDKITIMGTINAIDESGVTIQPDSVEKQEEAPAPGGDETASDDETAASNPQTDFVMKQRRGMMSES